MRKLVERRCPMCNEIFMVRQTNARRFCSPNCRQMFSTLSYSERVSGKRLELDERQPIEAIDESGFDKLRVAILELAIKDYKKALKRRSKGSVLSLERFFRSKWGQTLSDGNGETIIKFYRDNGGY